MVMMHCDIHLGQLIKNCYVPQWLCCIVKFMKGCVMLQGLHCDVYQGLYNFLMFLKVMLHHDVPEGMMHCDVHFSRLT
jgi:hypothetical protein